MYLTHNNRLRDLICVLSAIRRLVALIGGLLHRAVIVHRDVQAGRGDTDVGVTRDIPDLGQRPFPRQRVADEGVAPSSMWTAILHA
jgi:hypothetical protein